jgi:hypothetical protein
VVDPYFNAATPRLLRSSLLEAAVSVVVVGARVAGLRLVIVLSAAHHTTCRLRWRCCTEVVQVLLPPIPVVAYHMRLLLHWIVPGCKCSCWKR